MSYKLLQVSQLSALGVIGDDYLNYPLYKNDLLMATIGTESSSLSTAKVTIEELTQSIFQVGNTTSPWISADVGAIKRVYAPGHAVAIGSTNWASEHPYEAKLTVLGGVSSNQGLSAAPTKEGFRTVLMGNVGINTNTFGTSETYRLNVAGNANVTGNVTIGGNTDITGNLTVGGNIDGGDAAADTFTINADIDSNIIPDGDSTRNLGDSSNAWANIYVDTLHIKDGSIELPDNKKVNLGDGDDLEIYHNATDSYVENNTGHLRILNNEADKDIILRTDNGSGGLADYITCDGSTTAVQLAFGGSTKFQTAAVGTSTTGSVSASNGLVSTVQSPHPPLAVASTVKVTNLNVDKLDDKELWSAANNWDVVTYTNSSGETKVGAGLAFYNADGTADASHSVTLDTGGGTSDLYINGAGDGTGDRIYNTSDFNTQNVAHCWVTFTVHGTSVVVKRSSGVSGVSRLSTGEYRVSPDNTFSGEQCVVASQIGHINDEGPGDPGRIGYVQPAPYISYQTVGNNYVHLFNYDSYFGGDRSDYEDFYAYAKFDLNDAYDFDDVSHPAYRKEYCYVVVFD